MRLNQTINLLLLCSISCFFYACGTSTTEKETNTPSPTFTPEPKIVAAQTINILEIGSQAPDFNLPATDGDFYELDDFKTAKLLAIVFTCNHCPTAQAYEDRLVQLAKDYEDKGVQIVAISTNSPLTLLDEECGYTDLHDDFEDMIQRATDKNFPFPYLYDGDDHAVAVQYGPAATPHVFVFDAERTLQYRGRLDSLERPDKGGNSENVRAAFDDLLAGNTVKRPTTKTFGCSIKWSWKNEWTNKVNEEWTKKAVTLEPIDEAGVKALIKNEESKNLRLINIWATWCGPCVVEYSEFLTIQRMFGDRQFEFVSISADKPDKAAAALAFLKKKHSSVKNYIFAEDDIYNLVELVDPNWDATLPYTLLIEPNGKIVMAHQGIINPLEIKKAIVDHPMIGRYF